MAEYCDPDLIFITETKLDGSIYVSELLPKHYVGEFRRDWCRGHVSDEKDCYTITDLLLPTTTQNESEIMNTGLCNLQSRSVFLNRCSAGDDITNK